MDGNHNNRPKMRRVRRILSNISLSLLWNEAKSWFTVLNHIIELFWKCLFKIWERSIEIVASILSITIYVWANLLSLEQSLEKKSDFNLMKIKITNGIRDEKCRVLFKLIELFKIIWHLKIKTIFDSKSFRVHFWECGHQHEIPHKIFPDILSQYSSHSWYRWSVDVSYTKAEKPPTQKLTRIFFVLLKLLYINP